MKKEINNTNHIKQGKKGQIGWGESPSKELINQVLEDSGYEELGYWGKDQFDFIVKTMTEPFSDDVMVMKRKKLWENYCRYIYAGLLQRFPSSLNELKDFHRVLKVKLQELDNEYTGGRYLKLNPQELETTHDQTMRRTLEQWSENRGKGSSESEEPQWERDSEESRCEWMWEKERQLIAEEHKKVIAKKIDLVEKEIESYNRANGYEQELNKKVQLIIEDSKEAARIKESDPERFKFYCKLIFKEMLEKNLRPDDVSINSVVEEELNALDKGYTDEIALAELRETIAKNGDDPTYEALETLMNLIDPNSQKAKEIRETNKTRYTAYCEAIYIIASRLTPNNESFDMKHHGINAAVTYELAKRDIRLTGGKKFNTKDKTEEVSPRGKHSEAYYNVPERC